MLVAQGAWDEQYGERHRPTLIVFSTLDPRIWVESRPTRTGHIPPSHRTLGAGGVVSHTGLAAGTGVTAAGAGLAALQRQGGLGDRDCIGLLQTQTHAHTHTHALALSTLRVGAF